jgi:hypothetical protein
MKCTKISVPHCQHVGSKTHAITQTHRNKLLGLLNVGSLQSNDDWLLHADVLGGVEHARGDDVTAHDASEDVHQDGLHLLVRVQQLEGLLHLGLGGSAAHVQEVGRVAAVQLLNKSMRTKKLHHTHTKIISNSHHKKKTQNTTKTTRSNQIQYTHTLMISMVAMARPAPLTMHPMFPVSPM